MNVEKLQKMAGSVRTGGKGSVRRKKKAVHKAATTDDKRLQGTLKRLGVNAIPGIEEVNLFMGSQVVHFASPKVQASIAANTFVVSGPSTTQNIQDMLPGILPQLGQENVQMLKNLVQQGGRGAPSLEDDDDEVPALVQSFDEA